MVHLLEQVADEPHVVEHLVRDKENQPRRAVGGAAARTFNSPDLKTLRERLLTTVAASSAHIGAQERQKKKGVLDDRPFLTK